MLLWRNLGTVPSNDSPPSRLPQERGRPGGRRLSVPRQKL